MSKGQAQSRREKNRLYLLNGSPDFKVLFTHEPHKSGGKERLASLKCLQKASSVAWRNMGKKKQRLSIKGAVLNSLKAKVV